MAKTNDGYALHEAFGGGHSIVGRDELGFPSHRGAAKVDASKPKNRGEHHE
jgi:hypothetical protein